MSTRTDIATALSTVQGVTGHAYYVQSTNDGTAYVRLERVDFPNPFGGVAHWQVVVLLPQDHGAAEVWVEQHLEPIREAIEPHLVVTSAQLQQIQFQGSGVVPVLVINGHREAD